MTAPILEQIVTRVSDKLPAAKRERPISTLREMPAFHRETTSFSAALRGNGLSIIAEIKKASPSKGVIRNDFNATELGTAYQTAEADAISVLTEPDFFLGSLEFLESVRSTGPTPLLRKDFVVDPYQVYEARAFGADAILLIVAILERRQLEELFLCARELGLASLVEVHNISELDKLDLDLIDILGVNNRDLSTFEVDIEHAPYIFSTVPEHLVRVAESGFASTKDLLVAQQQGIDAVLIGEAFMRAEYPAERLIEFRRALRDQDSAGTPPLHPNR